MNEKDFDKILKADNSLRDAIRHREEKRPPMPEGLNDRLMQRIEKEVPARPAKTRRLIWPWIAAACVAAIIVVLLMPPRMSQEGTALDERRITKDERRITKNERRITKDEGRITKDERRITKDERRSTKDERRITKDERRSTKNEKLSTVNCQLSTVNSELNAPSDVEDTEEVTTLPQAQPKPEPRMLTERDIPITRPENYHYTPEEIALMKKQAREAYLKWVELELEIAKHNLEQMAQQ